MSANLSTSRRKLRRGLSASDLLVSVAASGLLVTAILPLLAQVRSSGGEAQSAANLQALGFANAIYAWDFNDRQWTVVPDDFSVHSAGPGDPCANYIANGNCLPPLLLGWQGANTVWIYALGCGEWPGWCGNFKMYVPCTFAPNTAIGSFRVPNFKSFHDYVDGRFYSEAWYAPLDYIPYENASRYFDEPFEFAVLPPDNPMQSPWWSSYCFSPAAMWNPEVFGHNRATGGYYNDPNGLVDGYASPSVSQAAYPDLKTRMIEHNWNDDPPSKHNPFFAGDDTPYFFNHGAAVTPWTLFFDGHVAELPTSTAVAHDAIVLAQTGGEVGLWSRDTPLGSLGYYGWASHDGTVASHHVLTVDGILGRDVLAPEDVPESVAPANAKRRSSRPGATPARHELDTVPRGPTRIRTVP